MKENTKKTILIIAIILVAGLVLSLIVLTATHEGGQGKHYDFECLTKPTQKPLTDCEEK